MYTRLSRVALVLTVAACDHPTNRGDLDRPVNDKSEMGTTTTSNTPPGATDGVGTMSGGPTTPTGAPPTSSTPTATYTPVVDPTSKTSRPADHLVAVVTGGKGHEAVRGTVHFRERGGSVAVSSDFAGLPAGTHGYHVHVYGDCSDLAGESPGPHLDFAKLTSVSSSGVDRIDDDSLRTGASGGGIGTGGGGMSSGPSTTGTTGGTTTNPNPGTGTTPGSPPMPGSTTGGTTGGMGGTSGSMAGMDHGSPDGAITGNLGDLKATSGAATGSTTLAELRATDLGMLTGRAVVVHAGANDPSKGSDGGAGAQIACGVIGVAGDATGSVTPTSTDPD
ncbi:MAG: superoxide dismutase family protein, partial [Myxococcota bacterium]